MVASRAMIEETKKSLQKASINCNDTTNSCVQIAGCDPDIMGIGPVFSSMKALDRAGLKLSDMDFIEMNEAFAAQSLACVDELGVDMNKLNVHGGAIAIGHPLGASGARITGKAASLLHNSDKQYALSTMCVGGGQGCATVLERSK